MNTKKTAHLQHQGPPKRRQVVQTASFQRSWKALPPEVQRSVQHKVAFLSADPRHPSLHVHRLRQTPGMWVCSVSRSYCLLYRVGRHRLLLIEVSRHPLPDRRIRRSPEEKAVTSEAAKDAKKQKKKYQ